MLFLEPYLIINQFHSNFFRVLISGFCKVNREVVLCVYVPLENITIVNLIINHDLSLIYLFVNYYHRFISILERF